LRRRFIPIWPALRWDLFDIMDRGGSPSAL
jgi:hypothetical protein